MEKYPTWTRLHPVSTDSSLATAVEARLHDPLWLLGRQWQMGELRHDAGATPIGVRVKGKVGQLTRLRGDTEGTEAARAVKPRSVPLEAAVECERVFETNLQGLRLRSEAGLQLVRMLNAAGLATATSAWIKRCPFALPEGAVLDTAAREWWDLIDGRVPDGEKLRTEISAALDAAATPKIPEAEAKVLLAWQAWHGARFEVPGNGPSTWNPQRMEYSFALGGRHATGEAALAAPEYLDGKLDWYHFEQGSAKLGATGEAKDKQLHRIPAPLDFVGMPNPRFWTFEDAGSRFDALELLSAGGNPTPATLMVLDFALSYSDDWFLVPLALDAWTIFDTPEITVTDAFGDAQVAAPPGGRWNMFRLDKVGDEGKLSRFYLAASPAAALEGKPIEEMHLLRDEISNVAWAVERFVTHPLGHGSKPEFSAPPATPQPSGLTWTLAPPGPPQNWFPLLPVNIGQLALGTLWSARDAVPGGRMLKELRASKKPLHQEEVLAEGAQLTRTWHSARGADGSLHFWVGRAKTPRQTDLAPGVRFDVVESK